MIFTEYTSERLRESYFKGVHESGLEVIVIPKEQTTLYALFATRYGSNDSTFKTESTGGFITVPDGIAHFLEHKMFENDDGTDTFSRFSKLGASANAYTSNDMTAYLFSATENYLESLEVLLDFVTHPYFTEETVNKEMGIITEELRMYEDNPYRWLYQSLLSALYVNNPVRIPVGGTEKSIREITPELLYDCYNTFYNLSNMTLVVSGNITPVSVAGVMDKALSKSKPSTIERLVPNEPRTVRSTYIEKKFPVSRPMFHIGLKEVDFPEGDLYIKRELEHSIICELIFGKTSEFYEKNYNDGTINQKFGVAYYSSKSWGHFIASGESDDPETVFRKVKAEIELYRSGKKEFRTEDYERAKKVLYSSCIQTWNSTSDIAEAFLDYHFAGADMLRLPEVLSTVTPDDIYSRLEKSYDTSLMSMSVAKPQV